MAQFDPNENDLVSLDDATVEFAMSRRTLYRLVDTEGLKKFKRPGDRKTYLSRKELRAHSGFREIPAKYDA